MIFHKINSSLIFCLIFFMFTTYYLLYKLLDVKIEICERNSSVGLHSSILGQVF
jgi:hypothetical protein